MDRWLRVYAPPVRATTGRRGHAPALSWRPLPRSQWPRRRNRARALAPLAAAAPLTLLVPRGADAAGDCEVEDRDTSPHKGFASTREGSGGQCTTHAARRFDAVAPAPGVNWNGNARYWYDHAEAAGWVVGDDMHAPRRGALAVWSGGAGHVAFIERVTVEGIEVSEMNWSQQMCWWSSRFRTAAWGRVAYATLTWDEVRLRLWHPFVGYVYPVRRELPDL